MRAAAANRCNLPDVGFVFQNCVLFPHLTSFGNVAYGLEVRNKSASDRVQSSVIRLIAKKLP
jgi:ABC-type sulfate/molybdate transport systems ATPase subunit